MRLLLFAQLVAYAAVEIGEVKRTARLGLEELTLCFRQRSARFDELATALICDLALSGAGLRENEPDKNDDGDESEKNIHVSFQVRI